MSLLWVVVIVLLVLALSGGYAGWSGAYPHGVYLGGGLGLVLIIIVILLLLGRL